MINFRKWLVTAKLRNTAKISFEMYTVGTEKITDRLEVMKSEVLHFYDFYEFEPHRFKCDWQVSSDIPALDHANVTGSLEMYSTTRDEFISKCEQLNEVIEIFDYEEIEDDEKM